MLAAKCPLLYPFPFFFPPPLFFSFILQCPNFFARQISLCLVLREPPLSRFISFRSLFSVAPVQRGGIIENYFRPSYYSFEYLFFFSFFFLTLCFNFFFQGIVSYLYIYIWSFDWKFQSSFLSYLNAIFRLICSIQVFRDMKFVHFSYVFDQLIQFSASNSTRIKLVNYRRSILFLFHRHLSKKLS